VFCITNHGFDDAQSNAVLHFVKSHCQQLQRLLRHTVFSSRACRLHYRESTSTTDVLQQNELKLCHLLLVTTSSSEYRVNLVRNSQSLTDSFTCSWQVNLFSALIPLMEWQKRHAACKIPGTINLHQSAAAAAGRDEEEKEQQHSSSSSLWVRLDLLGSP